LDISSFKVNFGFDPIADSAETLHQASALLRSIYASVGKGYDKSRAHVQRTVNVMDYENVYEVLPTRLPHLKEFLTHIRTFLS